MEKVEFELIPVLGSNAKAAAAEIGKAITKNIGGGSGQSSGDIAKLFSGEGGEAAGAAGAAGAFAAGFAAPFAALAAIPPLFEKMGDAAAGFVAKANPAAVERWQMAFDDMSAVIGHTLTPVLEAMTPYVRAVSDALATMLPSTEDIEKILKELEPVLEEFEMYIGAAAIMLGDIIKDDLIPAMVQLAKMAAAVARFFNAIIGGNEEIRGIVARNRISSFGASANQGHFVGIEELSKGIQTSAFGGGGSPAERTADGVEALVEMTKEQKNAAKEAERERRRQLDVGFGNG